MIESNADNFFNELLTRHLNSIIVRVRASPLTKDEKDKFIILLKELIYEKERNN